MPTQSHIVRVSVSSIFWDFIQERDELVTKVLPKLLISCRERQVGFVPS